MTKKRKKTTSKKKKTAKKPRTSTQKVQIQMQPVLVDNFVSLQKVMVNVASKLEDLSMKIQKLLDLFELSAKNLAKKDFKLAGESPEILKKLDNLSDQNKIIARGMTLMHEEMQKLPPEPIMPPMPEEILPMEEEFPEMPPIPTPSFPPLKPKEEYKKSSLKPSKPTKPKKISK